MTFFITPNIGLAGDLQGYGSYTQCTKPGAIIQGCASGNLFTYMFGPQLKARMARLQELQDGLTAAVAAWAAAQSPLLPGEREQYLEAIRGVIVGLYDALDTLAAVVERLERPK